MKQMLPAALSLFCSALFAQPTISSSYFPAAGDTLRAAVVAQPDAVFNSLITANNGPYIWNLSNAIADDVIETIYQNASEGEHYSQYAGADLVVINDAGERYFNKTANLFQAMGYAGGDPGGFGLEVIARYNPLLNEREAPLNLFDFGSTTTNLTLPFSADQLPDTLFAGLPIAPDSIRVRISISRNEIANAYGQMLIPGVDTPYDVLRVERQEVTNTGLDVKVPFLGWLDITGSIGGGAGGGLGSFLGADTTITHRFYANNVKDEIAVLTLNNDKTEVDGLRFKSVDGTVATDEVTIEAPGAPAVSAFPNPAVEWVRFDYFNLPEDDYTLKIFSLIGNPVWDETYHLAGSKFIRLDLDKFRKGTYLYSLANKKGDVIGTKRLVVVKP